MTFAVKGGGCFNSSFGYVGNGKWKSAIKEGGGGRLIVNVVKNFHFCLALPLPCQGYLGYRPQAWLGWIYKIRDGKLTMANSLIIDIGFNDGEPL